MVRIVPDKTSGSRRTSISRMDGEPVRPRIESPQSSVSAGNRQRGLSLETGEAGGPGLTGASPNGWRAKSSAPVSLTTSDDAFWDFTCLTDGCELLFGHRGDHVG